MLKEYADSVINCVRLSTHFYRKSEQLFALIEPFCNPFQIKCYPLNLDTGIVLYSFFQGGFRKFRIGSKKRIREQKFVQKLKKKSALHPSSSLPSVARNSSCTLHRSLGFHCIALLASSFCKTSSHE